MSNPHQKINEAHVSKEKDKEFIIDDIGKVDMVRVEKAVEYDNTIFDGYVMVI